MDVVDYSLSLGVSSQSWFLNVFDGLNAEAAVPEVCEAVEVAPEMRELDPADTHLVIRGVSVSPEAQTVVCFQ